MQSPDLAAAMDVEDTEIPESILATLELAKQYRALRVLIENEMHEVRQLKQDLHTEYQKMRHDTASHSKLERDPSTLGLMCTLTFDSIQLESNLLRISSQGSYFAVKHDMPEQNVEAKERREFIEHVGFDYKVIRWDHAKDTQLQNSIVQYMNSRDMPSKAQIEQLTDEEVIQHFHSASAAQKTREDYLWEADPYNWVRPPQPKAPSSAFPPRLTLATTSPDSHEVPISSMKSLMTYRDPVNWLLVATPPVNRPGVPPNPQECRARFIHFLRPSRSAQWEEEEMNLLYKIVCESHAAAPWPVIADRLNQEYEHSRKLPCARTPTECARRYFEITYKDVDKKMPFLRDEDEQLRRLVEKYGDKQWQFIAGNMVGRTGPQLMHRWMKALCPKARQAKANSDSSAWNTRQDMSLVCAVKAYDEKNRPASALSISDDVAAAMVAAEAADDPNAEQQVNDIEGPVGLDGQRQSRSRKKQAKPKPRGEAGRRGRFGEIRWALVQNHVLGKLDVQCRERWSNVLDPNLNVGPFTPEEDEILTEQVRKCGKQVPWSKLAHEFFQGRTDAMLSRRWKKLTTGSTKGSGNNSKKRGRTPKKPAGQRSSRMEDDDFNEGDEDLPLESLPPTPKRRKVAGQSAASSDAESSITSVANSAASTPSVAASRASTRRRVRSRRVSNLDGDGEEEMIESSGLQDLLVATDLVSKPNSPRSVSESRPARRRAPRVRPGAEIVPIEVPLPTASAVSFGFVEPSRQTLRAVSRMALLHDTVLATEPDILSIRTSTNPLNQHMEEFTGKWLSSVFGPSWIQLQQSGGLSCPDPRAPETSAAGITSVSIVDTSPATGLVMGATASAAPAAAAAAGNKPLVFRFVVPPSTTPSHPPSGSGSTNTTITDTEIAL